MNKIACAICKKPMGNSLGEVHKKCKDKPTTMTLEQLIEACGERLVDIGRNGFLWVVIGFGYEDTCAFSGYNLTEAVQKLYDYLKENNLLNNN